MLHLLVLVIATLALVTAANPLPRGCTSPTMSTLTMSCTSGTCSLVALDAKTADSVILVAKDASVYPGTPICQSGESPNAELHLEVGVDEPFTNRTGTFHLSVADLGSLYGATTPVLGDTDFTYPHWAVSPDSGAVEPQRTSAAQMWMSCNITVRGVQYQALSWGLRSTNGSWPPGCQFALFGRRFDVPVACDA